jgi:hypothetical protein
MTEGDAYHLKVTRIPWDPEDYILESEDYIFGMLLETSQMYFVMPDRKTAFVFVIGRGLVRLHHDFTEFDDDEEVDLFIWHLRKYFEIT